MKVHFLSVAIVLLMSGCGGDSPLKGKGAASSATGASNDGGGGSSLAGTWTYIYDNSQCEEKFTFSQSTKFSLSSLDEVAAGDYTSTALTSNSQRYKLVLSYTSDNGLPDCNGVSDFKTGLSQTKYFEFGSGVLNFYSTATATSIDRVYRK